MAFSGTVLGKLYRQVISEDIVWHYKRAPDAERAVKAWEKARAVLSGLPIYSDEERAQFLRERAKYVADSYGREVEVVCHLLSVIADAFEEVEHEAQQDPT